MNRVIVSATADRRYMSFLPILSKCWKSLGFQQTSIVVGKKLDDFAKKIIQVTECDSEVIILDPRDYNPAGVATFSRYYGSCFDYDPNDVVMFGDLDLIVLRMPWWEQRNEKSMHIYPANAYDHMAIKRFASCFIDAKVSTWRDVLNLDDDFVKCLMRDLDAIKNRYYMLPHWNKTWHQFLIEGRHFDEEFLSERIFSWKGFPNDCQMISRKKSANPNFFADRLDRSCWEESMDPEDIHFDVNDPNTLEKIEKHISKFCSVKWAAQCMGLRVFL
jgi:hypothetical protein